MKKYAYPHYSPRAGYKDDEHALRMMEPGMELRDYFAAKAMQVYMEKDYGSYLEQAQWAYMRADRMMKARGEK